MKCLDGHPTGRVYVGFDLQSEVDRALDGMVNTSTTTGNMKTIILFDDDVVAPTTIFIKQSERKDHCSVGRRN